MTVSIQGLITRNCTDFVLSWLKSRDPARGVEMLHRLAMRTLRKPLRRGVALKEVSDSVEPKLLFV